MAEKEEYQHITVRMPIGILNKMQDLAKAHHRDRSGEIIHACALYTAAHEAPNSPESYYAVLQALEELRSKMLEELEQKENPNDRKNPEKWVKVEEGWVD